jgi:hypothetical protein
MYEKRSRLSSCRKVAIAVPVVVVVVDLLVLIIAVILIKRRYQGRQNACQACAKNDTLRMEEGQQRSDLSEAVKHQVSKSSAGFSALAAARDKEQVLKEPPNMGAYEVPQSAANATQERATRQVNVPLLVREEAEASSGGNPFERTAINTTLLRRSEFELPIIRENPPQTEKQYTDYLSDFVQSQLPKFTRPDDQRTEERAWEVVERVEKVTEMCGRPDLVPELAKLSFYRFIILCGR